MKSVIIVILTVPEPVPVSVSCLAPLDPIEITLPNLKGDLNEKTY